MGTTKYLFILFPFMLFAQDMKEIVKKEKGTFYFGWGYNRDWYTKSNIHLQNNNPQLINGTNYTYDFTVLNATAHDRPQFDEIKHVANLTVPQFNFRIGYYFKKRKNIGIELNYDRAKYVATEYQKARIKGQINGNYFDKDTILDPYKFLEYEHTDGANFWMLNLLLRYDAWQSKNQKHRLSLVAKPGFGIVYPRTDVTLFGNRINNNWKISGISVGLEAGLRLELFKQIYTEFTAKGVYANYINALVQGKGYGKASQQFGCLEAILILGYQFKS